MPSLQSIDYRRFMRVICDSLVVGMGAFFLCGAMTTPASSLNLFALKLLSLCGAVVGVIAGTTEKDSARRLAVLLTSVMCLLHLYLHYAIWLYGMSIHVAEPMAILAVPLIVLGIAQAADWFARGQCIRVSSEKPRLRWRWLDAVVRLIGSVILLIRLLALGWFVLLGPSTPDLSTWKFVFGCLYLVFVLAISLFMVWLLTDATTIDDRVITTRHAAS